MTTVEYNWQLKQLGQEVKVDVRIPGSIKRRMIGSKKYKDRKK